MYIIDIVNQKGGVGKSTVVANLGAALAARGHSVIVVDADPQGTLTEMTIGTGSRAGTAEILGFGREFDEHAPEKTIEDVAVLVPDFGFRIIAANYNRLHHQEESLRAKSGRGQMALAQAFLEPALADYVIVDSPPNFGPLTMCGLFAADGLLVPIDSSAEATHGLALLQRTVTEAREVKSDIKMIGAVLTKFNNRTTIDRDIREFLDSSDTFPWSHPIRYTSGFKKSFLEKKPLRSIAASDAEKAAVAEFDQLAERITVIAEKAAA